MSYLTVGPFAKRRDEGFCLLNEKFYTLIYFISVIAHI